MKNKFLVLSTLLLLVTVGADAQWKFAKYFPDTVKYPIKQWPLGVNNGIAVDPAGKIWIQSYGYATGVDSLATGGLYTGVILVFNPDGSPVSFSPIKILSGKDQTGASVTDTLSGNGYGLSVDPSSGNILSIKSSVRIWKIDYKTGKGIVRNLAPIPGYTSSLGTPMADKYGEVFIAPVVLGNPVSILNPDFSVAGTVLNATPGYSRCIAVSADGNDVYVPSYDIKMTYVYHSNNGSLGPYVKKDSILKGLAVETMTWHPKTGYLWVTSGNVTSGMPDPPYLGYRWYAYNITTRKIVDSIVWYDPQIPQNGNDQRPRGIAFNPGGDTAYVATFNSNATPPSSWVQLFTTSAIPAPPSAPTLVSPVNGATGVSTNPTFSWSSSPGATSYQLQVSTSFAFSTLAVNQSGIAGTSFSATGLNGNTMYYWRVNATNAGGTSSYSSMWGFTTGITAPVISLSSTLVSFGNITVGTSSQQGLTINNTGNAALNVTSISSNNGVFTVSPTNFSVAAGGSQAVTLTFTPSAATSYSGTISITHNASGSPTTVSVTGTGVAAPAPAISVSPSPLTFGNTTVGTTSQQSLTISNTGNAVLSVSSISSSLGAFTLSPTTFSIAAGGNQSVVVTFTPSTVGVYSGTITINHNASGSPTTVNVTGTGVTAPAPAISVSPTLVSFGSVTVGTTGQQSMTISNTGNAVLTVSNISSSISAFAFGQTAFSVAAGGNQTVIVTFTPSSVGLYSGTITITHSASGSPATVSVTGTGVAAPTPAIFVSPSQVPFGSVTVGASSQQSLTINNTGNAALIISSISSTISACTVSPTSFSVSAGGNQIVTVTFTPTAVTSYSGTITITHNASGSPTTVSVTGIGVAAPTPTISVSASSLAFGSVNTGSSSQKTFTVSNSGTATLGVSNIASNNAAFTASPTTLSIPSGGAAQTVTVTFAPTALQSYSGTLSVTHNASGSPTQISVTGTGAGVAAISLSNPSLSFATVNIGSSSSQNLNVTNSGNIALTVTNLSSSNSSFVANPTSFTVSPGGTQVVTVTFTPSSGGTQSSTFTFTSNAATSPTFTASGTGETRLTASSTQAGRFSGGIPPSTWVLMSIPYKLDNTAASTLSSQLSGDTPWKLYTYQNSQNVEITNAGDAFTVARGFWFKTTAKSSSFNAGFGAGDLVGGSTYAVTISSGWSLVGPPFVSEEASWTPVNTTAGSSGIRVYKYVHENNAGWQLLNPTVERMKPYGGYAVYNGTGSSATFTFVRGGPLASIQEWQLGDGWYGVVAVGETRLRIGEHKMASAGEDGLDYPMPPPRPESDAQAPYVSDGLWSDIKPIAGNTVTRWKITVDPRTNQSLKLEELVGLPEGWGIMIDGIPNQGALKLKGGEEIHFSKAIGSPIVVTVLVGPAEMVEKESLPKQFILYQNYPNPFNPTTSIRYQIANESVVSLRIYNALGEEVATLVNGPHKPGFFEVQWDGKNFTGRSVASGVYYCELRAGSFVKVSKLLLLK